MRSDASKRQSCRAGVEMRKRIRMTSRENVVSGRSWICHACHMRPHPMFLFHTYFLRVIGYEVSIFVKAQPPAWAGRNFFVIDRFKPSRRLQAALQVLVPGLIADAGGYLYLFDTTYQSELVRFKEPDYMLNTFRSVQNDSRMRSYLAEYQPAVVEINEPNVLNRLVSSPLIHVFVSTQSGKGRGALATPDAAMHWENGVKPRLLGHSMERR